MSDQRQEVLRIATELYNQQPDWVTFFREVLGLDGVVRRAFPEPHQLADFEQTDEHQRIQQMVAKLRERDTDASSDSHEPTRVITVRLPKSLHESLKAEAHEKQTSMNKLCISKLLQVVDNELIPVEAK